MLTGQTIVVLGPESETLPLVLGLQRAAAQHGFHLHALDPATVSTDLTRQRAEQADVLILSADAATSDAVRGHSSAADTARSGQTLILLMTAGQAGTRANPQGIPTAATVRAVCNEPICIGAGVTALAAGSAATPDALTHATALFETVGQVFVVEERLIGTVAAILPTLTGAMDQLAAALAGGGIAAGLAQGTAETLAAQTVLGAAMMVAQTGEHPAMLKDRVTSPAGTTIAGLHVLEQGGLRAALISAVADAAAPPSDRSSP